MKLPCRTRHPAVNLLLSLVVVSLPLGCATSEREGLVSFLETPAPQVDGGTVSDQKRRLLALTAENDSWRMAVRDVIAALEAEEAEASKDWESASKKWLEVLQIDAGPTGAEAFQRWIKASGQTLANDTPAEVMARLLLAETHEGLTSPWLVKNKLTNVEAVANKIDESRRALSKAPREISWPNDPSAISDDPFWEKAAQLACHRELIGSWVRWERKLNAAQRDYWKGLLAFCRNEYLTAAIAFQAALPALEKDPSTIALAIHAADRLIQAQKRLSRREEAAAAYRWHHKILLAADVAPEKLGWSPFELLSRQAEAGLWVGRMQSLLGDYQTARIAIQQSIDLINKGFATLENLSRAQKIKLDEQKADAYHILASRIAYEQKDFAGALAFNKLAQSIPEIGQDWQHRLLWSEGWYKYHLNDKPQAIVAWLQLFEVVKDESQIAKLSYWLARTYDEIDQTGEADPFIERLDREFPLSFYTIVALPKLRPTYRWKARWLSREDAQKRLTEQPRFDAKEFEADPEASRRLLRAELMLLAGVSTWTSPLSLDLYRYTSQKGALLKELEAALYVTRLLHMSGLHLHAISLNTQLANIHPLMWEKFPEQLLVYFPQPHIESYRRAAAQHYIDHTLPLAISRQESSFQADALSPAEAVGLMQLIVPTAEKQARKMSVNLNRVTEDLKRADLNISLGTSYLAELGRRYRGQWSQAFAAYNAGEYVVDAWILRRASEDPILWTEALSFGETSAYVKNVWRNWEVYGLYGAMP